MSSSSQPFILQVVGYKNSGKTTLIGKTIEHLKRRSDYKIATIKHDAHQFELDHPYTDTWYHQQAGADLTLIQSTGKLGMIARTPESESELSLDELIRIVMKLHSPDVILIEGFKKEAYPKVVLIRGEEDIESLSALSNIQLSMTRNEENDQHYFDWLDRTLQQHFSHRN